MKRFLHIFCITLLLGATTPIYTLQLAKQAWNSSKARKVTAVVVGGCIMAGLIWRMLRTPSTPDDRPQQPDAVPSLTASVQALAAQAKAQKEAQKKSSAQQQQPTSSTLSSAATQVGMPDPRSIPEVSATSLVVRVPHESQDDMHVSDESDDDTSGAREKIDFQVTPISSGASSSGSASTTPVVESRGDAIAARALQLLDDESGSDDTGGRTIPISPRPQPGDRQVTVITVKGKPVPIRRRK